VRARFFPSTSFSVLGSQLLTQIDFTFPKGALGDFPATGPIPDKDTSITTDRKPTAVIIGTVQQPLSQIYKIKLNSDLAKASREESKAEEKEQRHTIINQVKKAYYAVIQSENGVRYAAEQIKLFQEMNRITENYVLQRVALKTDELQVKAKLAQAEYEGLSAKNQLDTQKEQLNILLGRDIRTDFQVMPVPEETAFEQDIHAAQTAALERRPELQQARLKLKEADYDRRIKKSHELAEKTHTVAQAKLAITEAENKVLVDVNSNYRKLQESRQLVTVAKIGQDAAQENVRILANKYKEQSALLKDVLQSQTSLEDSKNQYQNALLSFWAAKADFEKSMGE
jgi:outer membrane protein